MAVKAHHNTNLFSSHQFITSRDFMKLNQENDNIMSYVDIIMDSSTIIPKSFLLLYDQSPIRDKVPEELNPLIRSRKSIFDSPIPAPLRKCMRDSINELTRF
ncbi:hypothetical protein PanWU01x14_020960 [Parasponia andersonii]|uniref:Uncharacterized protein n=1 Tax=Parasponia andersonii TaxID=3476 RepID=A0A2P5DXU9_PARAD|nr:hypothetical protein PanWU01x14_020960 [Parasponia andersonii]